VHLRYKSRLNIVSSIAVNANVNLWELVIDQLTRNFVWRNTKHLTSCSSVADQV